MTLTRDAVQQLASGSFPLPPSSRTSLLVQQGAIVNASIGTSSTTRVILAVWSVTRPPTGTSGRSGATGPVTPSRPTFPLARCAGMKYLTKRPRARIPAAAGATSVHRRSMKKSANVIAIGNQKGGTGKSTVTVHLAAALGLAGKRCLIIDLDPASGATKHLGVPTDTFAGTLELLTSEDPVESLVVTKGMPAGVELVPSRPQLAELEGALSRFSDRTRLLERALEEVRSGYDYVLLDTSPSAGFATTVAAYSAAEWFLLTAFPHPLSLAGLSEAFRDIADVRRLRNPSLEILGVLLTNVDRRAKRMQSQIELAIDQAVPGRRFQTSISQAVAFPDASGRGCTVFQLPSGSGGLSATQFLDVAWEVENRVAGREAFLRGDIRPTLQPMSPETKTRLMA
jgi:chromosome partitioning protein